MYCHRGFSFMSDFIARKNSDNYVRAIHSSIRPHTMEYSNELHAYAGLSCRHKCPFTVHEHLPRDAQQLWIISEFMRAKYRALVGQKLLPDASDVHIYLYRAKLSLSVYGNTRVIVYYAVPSISFKNLGVYKKKENTTWNVHNFVFRTSKKNCQ